MEQGQPEGGVGLMAASDHLNGQQFYHSSDHAFQPGQMLTREGAWNAKNPTLANDPAALKRYKLHSPGGPYEDPAEDHLYYADKSFLSSGEAKGYGQHTYAVEPLTASGRKPRGHQPDPHYTSEGMTGAYRTRGQLRVLHEVDEQGNKVGG
jgi:hypothetical protein